MIRTLIEFACLFHIVGAIYFHTAYDLTESDRFSFVYCGFSVLTIVYLDHYVENNENLRIILYTELFNIIGNIVVVLI